MGVRCKTAFCFTTRSPLHTVETYSPHEVEPPASVQRKKHGRKSGDGGDLSESDSDDDTDSISMRDEYEEYQAEPRP